MKNKILIFGITGQDGSYLANIYLKNNFVVHGISRKKNNWDKNLKLLMIEKRIKIFKINHQFNKIKKILKNNYKYIFFLGGQSSVIKSYSELEYETYISQIQPLKIILEQLRNQKKNNTKLLFSSSSEIYGEQKNKKLNELSLKQPQSPYGLSKLIGYELIKSYREMFNIKCFSIIFFNHESILRNDNFIFKKISNYIKEGNFSQKLQIGRLDVIRNWGSSEEYMNILSQIMKNNKVEDYVLATRNSTSLRDVVKLFFKKKGINYKKKIKINKNLFRKYEIKANYADVRKLKKLIKIYPKKNYKDLVNQFLNNEF